MYENNCGCGGAPESKRKEINKGVTCDVEKCYYNDGKCNCTAAKINIGCCDSVSGDDTVCATFRNKEE